MNVLYRACSLATGVDLCRIATSMTICFLGSHSFCSLWHVSHAKSMQGMTLCMGVRIVNVTSSANNVMPGLRGRLAMILYVLCVICVWAVHLLLRGYFIVHKCLHYNQQVVYVSTSPVLCMYEIPAQQLNAFNVHNLCTYALVLLNSHWIAKQNWQHTQGMWLTLFGILWQFW